QRVLVLAAPEGTECPIDRNQAACRPPDCPDREHDRVPLYATHGVLGVGVCWVVFRLALWLTAFGTAFRVRWMLVEHLRSRISAVLPMSASIQEQNAPSSILTFFLSIWYLQYKINEMVDSDAAWQEEAAASSTI